MIKRFADIARFVVISPEMLFLVSLVAAYVWQPQAYQRLGGVLSSNPTAIEYLVTVPVGLSAVSFGLLWKILFPTDDRNKLLIEWDGYRKLRDRACWSVILCVLCAGIAVCLYVFLSSIPIHLLALCGAFSWVTPLITSATSVFAAVQVRTLLEPYQ
jgi:hypothetical protein